MVTGRSHMLSSDCMLLRILGICAGGDFPVDRFICMLALSRMVLVCMPSGLDQDIKREAVRHSTWSSRL